MNSHGKDLDDDTMTIILIGILAGPALLAVLAAKLPDFSQLLIDLQILVPPHALPILQIPGTDGAGLDWVRVVPLVSMIIICLVWAVWLIARRRDHEDERKGKVAQK